jgi:hypothetical protein
LELKGVPIEKKLVARTPEGIDVLPLYRREDAAAPLGEQPCVRGTRRPAGQKVRWEAWTKATEYDFSPLPSLAMVLAETKHDPAALAPADPVGWLVCHGSLPLPLVSCFDDMAQGIKEAESAGLSSRTVGIGIRFE